MRDQVSKMKLLEPVTKAVDRRPGLVIVSVVVITLLLMGVSMMAPQGEQFDQSAWAPDDEAITALDDIGEKFESTRSVMV